MKRIMTMSPESKSIGEKLEQDTNENKQFRSHKSTPKIGRAVNKIKALNEDTRKHNNQKLVFLDTNNKVDNKKEELKASEAEREAHQKGTGKHYIYNTSNKTKHTSIRATTSLQWSKAFNRPTSRAQTQTTTNLK